MIFEIDVLYLPGEVHGRRIEALAVLALVLEFHFWHGGVDQRTD